MPRNYAVQSAGQAARRGRLRREGNSMQLGPFQIKPKIIVLSRSQYFRVCAGATVGGYFLCRMLHWAASPRTQSWVEAAAGIILIVVCIAGLMNSLPSFIDR